LLLTCPPFLTWPQIRTTQRAITTGNIANECTFGVLKTAAEAGGLLGGMATLLGSVLSPSLRANTNWGKIAAGSHQQEEFYHALERFERRYECFFRADRGPLLPADSPTASSHNCTGNAQNNTSQPNTDGRVMPSRLYAGFRRFVHRGLRCIILP